MDIAFACTIAGIVLFGLAYIVKKIYSIYSLPPEQRKKEIVTYLKGIVALAEQEFSGSGRGQEKLAAVTQYFEKRAPMSVKLLFRSLGIDDVGQLVEIALSELKDAFEK